MLDTSTPIDPLITGVAQPGAQAVTLPTRTVDDNDGASDGEGNEGGEKRRKLNLWKCRQCRDARKKCFPADRTWPQKCNRCLQHRPEPLPCSEPELNTRKRGKNLSTKEKEKTKQKEKETEKSTDMDKGKDPKPLRRSKTRSSPDKQEPGVGESDDDEDAGGLSDDELAFSRPVRTLLSIGIKREHPGSPTPELPPPLQSLDEGRPASCYLPLKEGEFRILKLAPGRKDDKIVCRFETAPINDPPKYETISYVWGAMPQKSMEIMLVDPQGNSHAIWIKSNLCTALRSLRHPKDTRSFWVDALCINHSSPTRQEKNKQIKMKLPVFSKAENLCFWLGEGPDCKAALRFIPRILDLAGIDKLVQNSEAVQEWASFVALLKNPVFSRLWLVQEVAVARNVTLHCGQPAIHYGDLVDAVAIFKSFRNDISLLFRKRGENYKDLLTDRNVTMAERFIHVSTNAFRINDSGRTQRPFSLEALVSMLSDLNSSDPLDRIYSVLAIAKDGPNLEKETPISDTAIQIDYDKDILDLYQDFVVHAIQRSYSLDIICRHWASPVNENLPTWVRTLQLSLQTAFNSNISDRTVPDSLVGLPDHNYYHASRGTAAIVRFKSQPSLANDRKSLLAHGMRLDAIAKLGPRSTEGIIPYEWLALGQQLKDDGEGSLFDAPSPEDFWRTLVASRGPNGSNPPSWYTRAFLFCLHHLTPQGDINTNRVIAECEPEYSLVVDFLRRVQSVTWNRKFLVSKKYGWFGLAPSAAKDGDFICVLFGCSVPVVLRPMTAEDGKEYFQLVGECYVQGIMDGEAIENSSEYGEEEFDIR